MSDGYCDVSFGDACDDADPCEFIDSRIVKARKSHICSECGGTIAAGETYKVFAYKFEGEFGSDKVCDPCREAAREFDYHIVGGSFWQMMHEEWHQGAHIQACINRLESARAKEHMRQQWIKWHDRRMVQRQQRSALRKSVDAVDPNDGHRES